MNPVRNQPYHNKNINNKEMNIINKVILITARKNNFRELFFAKGF